MWPLPQSRQAAAAAVSAAEAHVRTLQLERDRVAKAFADAQKARPHRNVCMSGCAANLSVASQTWQLREGELLSRVAELQDALAKSTESAAALEAALRARQSTSDAALLAHSVTEQAQVEQPARRGEVAELRRQLKVLEDTRRHEQRMLLDAEERAQALASAAAVRSGLCLPLAPYFTNPPAACCLLRPVALTRPIAQAHDRAIQELKALQTKHATALELLGERNERVDELEQDLAEARTIYRSQILMLCPQTA